MGLLDAVAGQVLGSLTGSNNANASPQSSVIQIITSLLGSQPGGLGGLIKAFEAKGLGNIIGSWIGTGQNQAISQDQLTSVLGGGQLANLAQQAGLSQQDLTAQLAQFLPMIIDKMTPNGQAPAQENGLGEALNMLKGLMK